MIGLKKFRPGGNSLDYAGVFVESLCIYPQPGRLRADGSLVSKKRFPNLFAKLGHFFTTGSYAGNGTEGDLFRLPDPNGRFLKPTDNGAAIGTLTDDLMIGHTHSVSLAGASHPTHSVSGVPYSGGPYGFSHWMLAENPENWTTRQGSNSYDTRTTNVAGGHSHSYSLGNAGGAETKPYALTTPLYVATGDDSNVAVAVIYGSDFSVTPGINQPVPALVGVMDELAKANMHAYRIRYPESASAATIATAHVEIDRQLAVLRSRYARVYVLAIGAGALLAARALTIYRRLGTVSKVAGVNGLYNPSGAIGAALTAGLTRYLGGSTDPIKASAKPIAPYYPVKCWHGANNTVIPASQATGFTSNVVMVPDLPHDANIVAKGIMADVINWFET